MRVLNIESAYLKNENNSVLISMGKTKVLTAASIMPNVPLFINPDTGGWITAEYSMLPRSSANRIKRDRKSLSKRGIEIERLIARSLRNAIDLHSIKGLSIIVDCDVIEADGGTRTASINGAMISLGILFKTLLKQGKIEKNPIKYYIASIGIGIKDNKIYSDIDYKLDSIADVDINIVMNEYGKIVEIQGTGERDVFSMNMLNKVIKIAKKDIEKIIIKQKQIVKNA